MIVAVLLTILKIVGCILLVVAVILSLLLFCPVRLEPQYSAGDFSLRVGFLCFDLQVIPWKWKKNSPPKKRKAKEKKPPHDTKQKEPQKPTGKEPLPPKEKKKGLPPILKKIKPAFVFEMLSAMGKGMRRIVRGIHFKHLKLCWPVHGKDAADTAQAYGKLSATAYSAHAFLQNMLNLQVDQFQILPDFNNEFREKEYFSCKISTQLYIMVIVMVYILLHAVIEYKKTCSE